VGSKETREVACSLLPDVWFAGTLCTWLTLATQTVLPQGVMARTWCFGPVVAEAEVLGTETSVTGIDLSDVTLEDPELELIIRAW
jgi:hypothetical protein